VLRERTLPDDDDTIPGRSAFYSKTRSQSSGVIVRLTSVAIAMLTLLTACSDSMSPPAALRGSWVEYQPLQPRGYMTRTLTFNPDNEFVFRVDTYGIYDGGASRSSFTEIIGEYQLHDDGRLEFQAQHEKSWDAFFGGATRKSDVSYSMFDDCTFSISGSVLALSYITYPADGPEPTVMHLQRKN
jgi:hypothetical protein